MIMMKRTGDGTTLRSGSCWWCVSAFQERRGLFLRSRLLLVPTCYLHVPCTPSDFVCHHCCTNSIPLRLSWKGHEVLRTGRYVCTFRQEQLIRCLLGNALGPDMRGRVKCQLSSSISCRRRVQLWSDSISVSFWNDQSFDWRLLLWRNRIPEALGLLYAPMWESAAPTTAVTPSSDFIPFWCRCDYGYLP